MLCQLHIMLLLCQCHVCLNLLLVDSQHLEQFLLFTLQYFIDIYQILTVPGNAQTQQTDKQHNQHQHKEIIAQRFVARHNHTDQINSQGYSNQPTSKTSLISSQREEHVAGKDEHVDENHHRIIFQCRYKGTIQDIHAYENLGGNCKEGYPLHHPDFT